MSSGSSRPGKPAPAWKVREWLGEPPPPAVVALYFIQMDCPSCREWALPQARAVHQLFRLEEVTVVAIHPECVADTLQSYLDEHGIAFPVAIDEANQTARAYGIHGVPTLVLIDRLGRVRRHVTGPLPDLQLGAELMSLVREA